MEVLRTYDLVARMPRAVVEYLETGAEGAHEDTPKTLGNCHNFIIGDNMLALEAMKKRAEDLGLRPYIVTAEQKGEPAEVAKTRACEILTGRYAGFDVLLSGGETTPTLPPNHGKGGRNQHYAAVSMLALKDYPRRWVVASVGTDGSDFLPDVAGAIVDETTLQRLAGADAQAYVDRYDAYGLLSRTGDSLIRTGNTGTNVGDVIVHVLDGGLR
jgi:glycerate-2-kinase